MADQSRTQKDMEVLSNFLAQFAAKQKKAKEAEVKPPESGFEGFLELIPGYEAPKKTTQRMAGDELQPITRDPEKTIEVTGADGVPTLLDMSNPADVTKLQQIQPKVPQRVTTEPTTEPATAPAPERSNMADKSELERMTAWVNANKGLAEKVKPGQAGYEEIQIALGRTPSLESQIDPQAFASNAVKSFSDTLKMDTVMPEGTTLGVADDLDEAYAKVSDPAFTEAIQKAFASGMNFATGARASQSPIKGTKPSQPFFEARTPGL